MLQLRSYGMFQHPYLYRPLRFALRYGLPLLMTSLSVKVTAQKDFGTMRAAMVEHQLRSRDISDPEVLQAMQAVPRHAFVPAEMMALAYTDRALPITNGQTISQPYIVAFMTQAVGIKPGDKVLEIGTGSGYQAAVLAEMGAEVFTIEIIKPLVEEARDRLGSLGYKKIAIRHGDGYHGWPEAAPFDAIIVTAGAEKIPRPLIRQLKEGGRMIIPVGPHRGVRQLQLLQRQGNSYSSEILMQVRFVPFTRNE